MAIGTVVVFMPEAVEQSRVISNDAPSPCVYLERKKKHNNEKVYEILYLKWKSLFQRLGQQFSMVFNFTKDSQYIVFVFKQNMLNNSCGQETSSNCYTFDNSMTMNINNYLYYYSPSSITEHNTGSSICPINIS